MIKKVLRALLFLGTLFTFFSCGDDSGLGAVVDTEAPKVEITYPPSLAIIKGSFIFGGTWEDDKSLKSITVTVCRTESDNSKTEVDSGTAQIDSDGTWQITLNSYDAETYASTNGWQYQDGDYEITVCAKDNAGHSSGNASRSFSIDNTAPVLVLTKPTTVGSNSARTYGRTVQLEGTFSEDCSSGISTLTVSFYDSTGKALFDTTFSNITDMSNANPLTIAQYYTADEEKELDTSEESYKTWQNYQKLYTSENIENYRTNGTDATQQIYFTVSASDEAKIYQDFEGKTYVSGGNVTETFYRGTTNMLNLINRKNTSFSDFSVALLKDYLNGTDETYLSNTELKAILDEAASVSTTVALTEDISSSVSNTSTEDGTVYLTFSINPNNNPTYTVSGLALNDGSSDTENYTDGYYNYYTDSTIVVTVSPGLDLTNLDTSTISIYYTKAGDESAEKKLFWTWNEDVAVSYAMAGDASLSEDAARTLVASDPATYRYTVTSSDENTDALSKSSTLSASAGEITYGEKYIFSAAGYDIDGQALVASDSAGFGFYAKSNASIPTVNFGTTDESTFTNLKTQTAVTKATLSEGLKFSGTVSSSAEVASVNYTVTLSDTADESNSAETSGSVTWAIQTGTEYVYDWSYTLSPTEGMASVISGGSGLYTVALVITANNGQEGVASRTYYLDTTAPAISNVSLSGSYTSGDVIYLNNSEPFTLSGTTTDNFTLSGTSYEFSGVDSQGNAVTKTGSSTNTSWSFSDVDVSSFAPVASDCDLTLTLTAKDSAGNTTVSSYSIEFDTTAPSWKTDSNDYPFQINKTSYDSESNWYKDSSLPVSGCYEEAGSGVAQVYYWVVTPEAQSESVNTADITTANGSFSATNVSSASLAYFTNQTLGSFTASLIEESEITPNTLYLMAVDNVGNKSSVQSFTINVDTESPSLSSETSGTQYTNGTKDITVSGTASDNVSGIESITLTVNGKAVVADLASDDATETTWTATISAESVLSTLSAETNSYKVNATVTDAAGNASSSTIFTLQLDTQAPSVSVTTPVSGTSTKINGTISVQGSVAYTGATPELLELYVSSEALTSTDDVSGLSKIGTISDSSKIYSWSFDGVDVKTYSGVTEENPSKTMYLILAVTDSAGNYGVNSFVYTVDQNTDRPVIQLTSIDDEDAWITSKTLKGTISDDDGISSFFISEDGSSYTPVTVSNGSWTYTMTADDGSEKPLYFKVIDTENTTFITGGVSGTEFTRPYYLYSSTTSSDYGIDNTEAISVRLDTSDPQISDFTLAISDDEESFPAASAFSSARYAGGDSKYIKVYATAGDANLSSVTLSLSDSDGNAELSEIALSIPETYTTTDGVNYYACESSAISIASLSSGTKIVAVSVTDKAGNVTQNVGQFSVDNTGPDSITVTSPSSSDEITGTATITGTAVDSGVGISSIEWLIPPVKNGTNYGASSVTDEELLSLDGWTNSNNTGSASIWKFKFTASSTLDLTQFDDEENYAVTYDSESETYKIPLYFKTTDTLGNYYIKRDFYITHNPDADRPVTEFSYPTASDYDTDSSGSSLEYITLAGTIRVSGTVEVPSGTVDVGQVYVQIASLDDVDSDGNLNWSSDYSALSGEFATLGGVVDEDGLKETYSSTSKVPDGWWGIAATTKTATWNLSLNTNSDLDPESGNTTNIAVRACAINADGKMGNWSDIYYIHVDSNAPSQSAVMRQYSSFSENALESNVSVSKDYSSEMYLKGTWYLTVTLEDNDSINEDSISVKKGSATQTYYSGDKTTTYKSDGTTIDSVTKMLYIPIETEEMTSSSVSYTVYVADTAGYSSSMTYTFYIDNTAPVISTFTVNDTYSLLDETSVPVIQNSNYKTTLDGTLTESGSGCERLFFYFMRDNVTDGSSPRLLDAMLENSESKLSSLDSYTISQDSSNTYTMYGKTYSGELDDGRTTFTATSGLSDDTHIRAGGLIYIGGEYQVISSVSGNSVTFETAISSSIDVSEAGFPYGQVVDSTDAGTWSDTTHSYASITESDGDNMVEIFKKTGTTWEWQGIFLSDNMADGPVTVVVIAFDAAGNVSGKSVSTSIQNNAPRLAKLYLGTDLSGDGKYASSEFNTYTFNTYTSTDASNPTANYKDSVDFETAGTTYSNYKKAFQIRSGLAVIPEITGGNSTIKMAFLKDASSSTGYVKSANASGFYAVDTESLITADFASSLLTNTTTSEEDSLHKFVIPDDDLASLSDGSGKSMSFTFWDSTDGTTCGTDSNYCFVRISDFTVARTDGTAPQSVINPFEWGSASSNSLYGNSTANGHIELESDWTSSETAGYSNSASSGQFDSDPKVSGKITMTGYAYDDQRLSSLWIAFDTFTPSGYYSAAGDYNATANSVAASSGTYSNSGTGGDSQTYYQAAYYTPSTGSWTFGSSTMSSNGWEFSVSDSSDDGAYLDQSGHKVIWTLSIDTEKISSVAQADLKARVIAFDRSYNVVSVSSISLTLTGTDGSDNVPLYQMDVVPYITSMTAATSVSGTTVTKRTNSIRSRRGAVPVQNSDYIVINGFNLSTSFYRQLEANKAAVSTLTDTITGTAITANESYYISAPTYSGYIIAETNGIYSLNNMNGETEYNYEASSTNTYASESDSSLDHYFDDRYVWVWQTGTSYTGSDDPNGFAIAKTTANKMYASWTADTAYAHTMTLGDSSRTNRFGSMKDSPEAMDMCIFNGKPYYVILDNWQGTSSSDPCQWSGSGLFVASDNTSYSQGTSGGTSGSYSYSNYSLEIQGNESATSPDSSDGLDEKLNQFRNPSITACWADANKSNVRVYVSYFDYYAKCLKYGTFVFTSGTTLTTTNSMRTATDPTKGYCVVAGYDTTVTSYSDYAANVGQYSAIGVDTTTASTPIPVIAYYDTENQMLKIARGKQTLPSTSDAVVTTEGTTPSATYGWYTTEISASNTTNCSEYISELSGLNLGKYVSMEVDDSGNLHIICQESEDGDLYYLHLTKNSDAQTYKLAILSKVDSANSVGKQGSIRLTDSSSTGLAAGPSFSYIDATNVETKKGLKIAYLSSYAGTIPVWEHMVAPISAAIEDEYTGLVLNCYDGNSVLAKYGIGYMSAAIYTAFLRGEE